MLEGGYELLFPEEEDRTVECPYCGVSETFSESQGNCTRTADDADYFLTSEAKVYNKSQAYNVKFKKRGSDIF